MIIEEYITNENGTVFIHHYTDDPLKTMLQNETGLTYDDAIDWPDAGYTYIEINKITEKDEGVEIT